MFSFSVTIEGINYPSQVLETAMEPPNADMFFCEADGKSFMNCLDWFGGNIINYRKQLINELHKFVRF